jgi:uncharacterized membrane protein
MMTTVFLLIACALIAAISVPLVLKLIPPNPVYGVRTERTTSRADLWYEVNKFAGKALLVAVGVIAILLMFYSGTLLRSWWAQLAVFVIAIGAAVGAILAFERRIA